MMIYKNRKRAFNVRPSGHKRALYLPPGPNKRVEQKIEKNNEPENQSHHHTHDLVHDLVLHFSSFPT